MWLGYRGLGEMKEKHQTWQRPAYRFGSQDTLALGSALFSSQAVCLGLSVLFCPHFGSLVSLRSQGKHDVRFLLDCVWLTYPEGKCSGK